MTVAAKWRDKGEKGDSAPSFSRCYRVIVLMQLHGNKIILFPIIALDFVHVYIDS